jgi:RNA-dependent RNA polymerase
LELRVYVEQAPRSWTTWELYEFFARFGNLSRIEILEKRTRDLHAVIFFRPAPQDLSWVGRSLMVRDPEGVQTDILVRDDSKPIYWYRSPNTKHELPERMTIPVVELGFGIMQHEDKMLVLHKAVPTPSANVTLEMNMQFKELNLEFPAAILPTRKSSSSVECRYKFRITPAQITQAFMRDEPDGSRFIIFTIESPPLTFRKTANIAVSHNRKATLWDERSSWYRQTDLDLRPFARQSPIELRKSDCIVEMGRWLTYRLEISAKVVASPEFADICQALADHNVNMSTHHTLGYDYLESPDDLWSWLNTSRVDPSSALSQLEELADNTATLPFPLRYQLEVCLSQGVLHESNMTKEFLDRLAAVDPLRAVKMLEKAVDNKQRYYDPMNVMRLHSQVSIIEKKRPGYCTKIPSVTITPTTMYFSTPMLETSNRVIRHYQQHEDRFLRVRFTDERYKGRIMSADDDSLNEVYSRIKRAMTHGIQIADRHYEYLAFGNSQFRDHGAYFFASTNGTSAADIRDWMGDFTNITVIAKYVSRLGQCFSTTRAIPHSVKVEEIPDVWHHGYCFTDGVGKISILLARMIAHHYGLPNFENDYPSIFQFRLAGCKGVFAVDPSLKGLTVQIRPSQNKFPARFHGLEICRISQYSTASLNVQIILVLSALGVPDDVFLTKLRTMLVDLSAAMNDERMALTLLQKNIDYNQMTISIASMIFDGFMETEEPFVISCLRLWRSWSLKYLKEKARIFIDQGCFPLGGTDETGTLKGHFKGGSDLPEVFLQIPDPEKPGRYKAVEGLCILARNPSLHPGDVRVVRAVDKAELRHYKNCVILPQTGDRDLANMCSGGDLDGDDYLVIWDEDLLPPESEWNQDPMDYTSPDPVTADGPVTVDDMTTFFVQHIKNDILSRIACAHRYWADFLDEGVKDPKCLKLAELHSKAVDYPKTGVPAEMGADLRVRRWPHWSEPRNKAKGRIYHSRKVLGKLYDEVKREPFHAAWDLPFDARILGACDPTEQMLQDARDIKVLYDDAIRRIMTQHGITTEFEVYTTFVLEHHQEIGDYKFAEAMGELTSNLKQLHRDLCYEKAGAQNRDWEKLKPFLVAMYQVTAEEVSHALRETQTTKMKGGRPVPLRNLHFDSMPFMSFPWIFAAELGRIATNGEATAASKAMPKPTMPTRRAGAESTPRSGWDILGLDFRLDDLPEIDLSGGVVREGELLDLRGRGKGNSITVVPEVVRRVLEEDVFSGAQGDGEDGADDVDDDDGLEPTSTITFRPSALDDLDDFLTEDGDDEASSS